MPFIVETQRERAQAHLRLRKRLREHKPSKMTQFSQSFEEGNIVTVLCAVMAVIVILAIIYGLAVIIQAVKFG